MLVFFFFFFFDSQAGAAAQDQMWAEVSPSSPDTRPDQSDFETKTSSLPSKDKVITSPEPRERLLLLCGFGFLYVWVVHKLSLPEAVLHRTIQYLLCSSALSILCRCSLEGTTCYTCALEEKKKCIEARRDLSHAG